MQFVAINDITTKAESHLGRFCFYGFGMKRVKPLKGYFLEGIALISVPNL